MRPGRQLGLLKKGAIGLAFEHPRGTSVVIRRVNICAPATNHDHVTFDCDIPSEIVALHVTKRRQHRVRGDDSTRAVGNLKDPGCARIDAATIVTPGADHNRRAIDIDR